jgi:hypothetical protein
LSKLSGITPERDDLVGSSSRSGSLQEHDIFPNTGAKPDRSEQARFGPCSVATHAPANDDEKIPVFVPQAPGEEITVSLLAPMPPLGYALGDPLAQAPAQASTSIFVLFLAVSPVADPLAEATPHVLAVLHKVDDEIPQILPRPYPVPEEIAQIAAHIAISVAPSLS